MAETRASKSAKRSSSLTYQHSGVDVGKAEELVQYLQKRAPAIGGFSGLFPFDAGGKKVFLVASTDGVGTKLKLAFLLERHDTVGIDLVAMCVNDLVTCGATPLFFLDYYATAGLNLARSKSLMDGILEGCRQGGMVLLGGETAEMPGFYADGEYDLAGFSVGFVHPDDLIDGKRARAGDVIVAFPSSGLHSNGFSLVRKALSGAELRRHGKQLLTPTRIYVDDVRALRKALGADLKALAHITGEGLEGNVPRVLKKGVRAVINKDSYEVPPIFSLVQRKGGISEAEMYATFNMGLGMVAIIAESALRKARKVCPDLLVVGYVEQGRTPFELRESAAC